MIKLGKYKHFKGKICQVIAISKHTETEELLVIYCEINTPNEIWARPVNMFTEEVDKPEYNYKGPRFKYLD